MSTIESHRLTPNEAAGALRIPLRQVHRIIDSGLLGAAVEAKGGARRIAGRGLLALKLAHLTSDLLKPEARREAVTQVLEQQRPIRLGNHIATFEIDTIEAELEAGLVEFAEAKAAVTSEPGILGGMPCFKGTRIAVHDVDDMLANGDAPKALIAAFPALDERRIQLATTYAAAYPRRGRPTGAQVERCDRNQ